MRTTNALAIAIVMAAGCGKKESGGARADFARSLGDPQGCFREVDEPTRELRATCDSEKLADFQKALEASCGTLRDLGFSRAVLRVQDVEWTLSPTDPACKLAMTLGKLEVTTETGTGSSYFKVKGTKCTVGIDVSEDKARGVVSVTGCDGIEIKVGGEAPRDVDARGSGWVPLSAIAGTAPLADILGGGPTVTLTFKRGTEMQTAREKLPGNWAYRLSTIVNKPELLGASGLGAKGGGAKPASALVIWHSSSDVDAVGTGTYDTVGAVVITTSDMDKKQQTTCGTYTDGKTSQSFRVYHVPVDAKVVELNSGKTLAQQLFRPTKNAECPKSIKKDEGGALLYPERKAILEWVATQLGS